MACEDKFSFSIDLKSNKGRVSFSIGYLKIDNYLHVVWHLSHIHAGAVNDCTILGF